MHGFYKYIKQKDEFCVLILGLDDAGKTVRSRSVIEFVVLIITAQRKYHFLLVFFK